LLDPSRDTFVFDFVRKVRAEIEAEESGFRYMVSAHCRMLVTRLIRTFATRRKVAPSPASRTAEDTCWAVEHAKFFIFENYSRHLNLGTIAWEVRLSAEHLARLFKKTTGQTVFEFIRDLRIESAKSYLISSKRSVNQISDLVGFSSPTLFCRNFRRATGIRPSQFRRDSIRKLSFQHTTLSPEEDEFGEQILGPARSTPI
jgi:AraC-like DNA-binding protein